MTALNFIKIIKSLLIICDLNLLNKNAALTIYQREIKAAEKAKRSLTAKV